MARSRVMRSAVSGWVENIRIMVRPENGFVIINALTGPALLLAASGLACVARSILAKACASASGSPVACAPEASAAYSRERLIAA
jgi:hypothetical protein